jgi:hypothetical protein
MTKQQNVEYIPAPGGKIVHARKMMPNDAVDMALIEQIFAIHGPASVARLLAWRLRQPSPRSAVLEGIARMLDPSEDGYLKLVVVRRRKAKTATRSVNDAAIAEAVKENMEARGNKRGSLKAAVAEVAGDFEVKEPTVRKALRNLNSK